MNRCPTCGSENKNMSGKKRGGIRVTCDNYWHHEPVASSIMLQPFDLSRLKDGSWYWAKQTKTSPQYPVFCKVVKYNVPNVCDYIATLSGFLSCNFYAIDTRPIEPPKELEEA